MRALRGVGAKAERNPKHGGASRALPATRGRIANKARKRFVPATQARSRSPRAARSGARRTNMPQRRRQ
ncbi:hypothetical protein BFR06_06155 [Burkholderia pseudomallei]|nr:hypothetical protein BFR05_06145 [Burkholderia pseudomallei]APF97497.1 hypothetical protein BFR06_06155 [Burkholderia pseudomallei]KEO69900.1 hypothetical protein J103_08960 [Burkholderia pseudomallei MSHR5855]ONC07362.1 hypothetical protein AQ910_30955 [Burkholderia pseudomallei]